MCQLTLTLGDNAIFPKYHMYVQVLAQVLFCLCFFWLAPQMKCLIGSHVSLITHFPTMDILLTLLYQCLSPDVGSGCGGRGCVMVYVCFPRNDTQKQSRRLQFCRWNPSASRVTESCWWSWPEGGCHGAINNSDYWKMKWPAQLRQDDKLCLCKLGH